MCLVKDHGRRASGESCQKTGLPHGPQFWQASNQEALLQIVEIQPGLTPVTVEGGLSIADMLPSLGQVVGSLLTEFLRRGRATRQPSLRHHADSGGLLRLERQSGLAGAGREMGDDTTFPSCEYRQQVRQHLPLVRIERVVGSQGCARIRHHTGPRTPQQSPRLSPIRALAFCNHGLERPARDMEVGAPRNQLSHRVRAAAAQPTVKADCFLVTRRFRSLELEPVFIRPIGADDAGRARQLGVLGIRPRTSRGSPVAPFPSQPTASGVRSTTRGWASSE